MGIIGEFVDPIIATALRNKREEKFVPDIEEGDTLLQYLARQTDGMSSRFKVCT
jgi:hypothetical protein